MELETPKPSLIVAMLLVAATSLGIYYGLESYPDLPIGFLAVCGLALTYFAVTTVSRKVERNPYPLLVAILYLSGLVFVGRAAAANFALPNVTGLLVVLAAAGLAFRSWYQLFLFHLVLIAAATIGVIVIPAAIPEPIILIGVALLAGWGYLASMKGVSDEPLKTPKQVDLENRCRQATINAIPDACLWVDDTGLVLLPNLVARKSYAIIAGQAVPEPLQDCLRVADSGDEVTRECELPRMDGVPGQCKVSIKRHEMGARFAYLIRIHDVSDLHARIQEVDEQRAVSEKSSHAFVAKMRHEVRSPLNGVLGMAQLLQDTSLTEDQKEYLDAIQSSGNALLSVVDDVLDYSALESGGIVLDQKPMGLVQCFMESLNLVVGQVTNPELSLTYRLDPALPETVIGDHARLRQVLINLLSNAIAFTREGQISARAAVVSSTEEVCEIEFAVEDSGIGIPDDQIDDVFNPFGPDGESSGRIGLGLSVSRQIVQLMGGQMWVESEFGVGSDFRFTVKLHKSNSSLAEKLATLDSLSGQTVLIVDDNTTHLRIVEAILSRNGLNAVPFAKSKEALQWVREGNVYDLAVLDLLMPEMDGRELGAALATIRPASPLLLLSSVGRSASTPKHPFKAELSKPVDLDELLNSLALLTQVSERNQLRDEKQRYIDRWKLSRRDSIS